MFGQDGVGIFTHQLLQLSFIGNIDRFASYMCIGITGAVPIEVIAAIAPTEAFVFANDGD